MRLQANSRHKETLLHCQRQGLDTPTEGTFTPGRAGNFGGTDPLSWEAGVSALTIPPSPTHVLYSGIECGLGRI